MKTLKKMVIALALLGSSTHALQADQCYPADCAPECAPVDYCAPDCCYEDSCNACVSPYIALGAIAVVAIIAIAVSDSGGHHHGHGHSN